MFTNVHCHEGRYRFYDSGWLRLYEGRCADAYFGAWQGLPIKWEASVKKSIPAHWLHVAGRASPLSKGHGARSAVCPVQAMLNYAYALLESQVRQALNALAHDLGQFVLDFCQFGEFCAAQVVQGFGVSFQHDDQPTQVGGWVGVIDEPVRALVNDWAGRNAFFAGDRATGKAFHSMYPLVYDRCQAFSR
jgi:hypothetical protein